ncbi:oxidoreductase [Pseudoclavibacter sp. AY1F1]|uniref:PDR/VanB family oxidoreductase n=1 Tax=Pseudoclavibacter sp. AY1F1 TaxID=2080583 RepID=UPI000CE8D3F4|nr:PDR/VanB family oxidoreductase [Pseudoclavibacter sp. AY1F1]PPF44770.1 oxidoreductase [Pseudoclavibacter sp. AY1F1]
MSAVMLELVVAGITELGGGVRALTLRDPSERTLPSFAPGSSIAVQVGAQVPGAAPARNSYSLTGPGRRPESYSISVRLDEAGRGGSRWMHGLQPGDSVTASAPSSAFPPVLSARHHLLIAGGIGVTPILSHARAAAEWGRSFEVVYAHGEGGGAHREELEELSGGRLTVCGSRGELRAHLAAALIDQPLGAHLYVCGPVAMIEAVTSAAGAAGWPDSRVHAEAFTAPALEPGEPFDAKLLRLGRTIRVESGTTLLDALLAENVPVPNLCRQGVCGECRVAVRVRPGSGDKDTAGIEHRDSFLTDEEKGRGDCLMPCVSRPRGEILELEL